MADHEDTVFRAAPGNELPDEDLPVSFRLQVPGVFDGAIRLEDRHGKLRCLLCPQKRTGKNMIEGKPHRAHPPGDLPDGFGAFRGQLPVAIAGVAGCPAGHGDAVAKDEEFHTDSTK